MPILRSSLRGQLKLLLRRCAWKAGRDPSQNLWSAFCRLTDQLRSAESLSGVGVPHTIYCWKLECNGSDVAGLFGPWRVLSFGSALPVLPIFQGVTL